MLVCVCKVRNNVQHKKKKEKFLNIQLLNEIVLYNSNALNS